MNSKGVEESINLICREVLAEQASDNRDLIGQQLPGEQAEIIPDLYKSRLRVLYSVVLEDAEENGDPSGQEELISQICSFERTQTALVEAVQEQYRQMTSEAAFSCFSDAAYGLAAESLKGKEYRELARCLRAVFQGLAASVGTDFSAMQISETLLDFSFAAGTSRVMSLRLKRYRDAAGFA